MAEEKATARKRTVKPPAEVPPGAMQAKPAASKAPAKTAAKVKAAAATPAAPAKPAPGKAPAKAAAKVVAAKAKPVSAAAPAKSRAPRKIVKKPVALNAEERQRMIAIAAYFRAERRGFSGGYELQDWFEAEQEIIALIGQA